MLHILDQLYLLWWREFLGEAFFGSIIFVPRNPEFLVTKMKRSTGDKITFEVLTPREGKTYCQWVKSTGDKTTPVTRMTSLLTKFNQSTYDWLIENYGEPVWCTKEELPDRLIETGRFELAYRYCKQNNIKHPIVDAQEKV